MTATRGGKRPGAGRPRGSKNKRTLEVEEQLAKLKFDPIEVMVKICRKAEKTGDLSLAGAMAKELAQYHAPKRRAVAVTMESSHGDELIKAIYAGRERAGID